LPADDLGFAPKDDLGFVPKAQPTAQPGLLRRLLSAYQEGSRGIREEQQRRNPGGGLLDKDSGDVVAGISTFLGGVPGSQPGSAEQQQRLGHFSQENPSTALALRLLGSGAQPAMLPRAGSAAAPMVAAAAPSAIEAAAPAVANVAEEGAGAAANVYEQLARGAKVTKLAQTIEANTIAHLGSDASQSPKFADTIAKMPAEWWEGMAQIAKVSKPSETTIGEVAAFFRDRAGQARTIQLSPSVAGALKDELPAAENAGPLWKLAQKLRAIPQTEATLSGAALGALMHGSVGRAAATALAGRYGPSAAAFALERPGLSLGMAANAARAAVGPSEVEPDDLGFVPRGQGQGGDPRTSSIPPGGGMKDYSQASYLDPDQRERMHARLQLLRGESGSYRGSASGSLFAHDPAVETGPETWAAQLHSTTNVLPGDDPAEKIRAAQDVPLWRSQGKRGWQWTTRR